MNDARALAAQALAEVALSGASLRDVAMRSQGRFSDARDRAFFTALLNEGARWWLRFDAALERLLQQPLPRREASVRALLVLGLVQLEIMQMPSYAAVAATVQAARALGRPRFAGLTNAVLRRWLRERDTLNAALDAQASTRWASPAWLLDAWQRDWPTQSLAEASNRIATPCLRVNRRHGSREAYQARLAQVDVESAAIAWLPDALLLTRHTDITRLPGFAKGDFSVQDGAAQCAADLLDARDGMRVLDACAAPGGKAAHLLERADVELVALDSSAQRLQRVAENMTRLGLRAHLREGDAGGRDWWDGRPFERILLDAPCSATGVIRRHPDIKLHRRADDIAPLVAGQRRMLDNLWPMLAPSGRLVYATCSLLRAENEAVIAAFLAQARDVNVVTPTKSDRLLGQSAGAGWQLMPGEDGVDGMFYAVLEKQS